MEWSKLLYRRRLSDPDYLEKADRPTFVQDADRITFSAPFRRLANKTQVHPLYENDHIHHRLIHSLETASVGRSLGISVGDWLEKEHGLDRGEKYAISAIVQAACLAHDIGNPPFGHPEKLRSEIGSPRSLIAAQTIPDASTKRSAPNSKSLKVTRKGSELSPDWRCIEIKAGCGC